MAVAAEQDRRRWRGSSDLADRIRAGKRLAQNVGRDSRAQRIVQVRGDGGFGAANGGKENRRRESSRRAPASHTRRHVTVPPKVPS